MSLIDPPAAGGTAGRPVVAPPICAGSSRCSSLASGPWDLGAAVGSPPSVASITASTVSIPLLILGGFLYQFGADSEDVDGPAVFMPFAAYFVAVGIGMTGGQWRREASLSWLVLAFAIAGADALDQPDRLREPGVSR